MDFQVPDLKIDEISELLLQVESAATPVKLSSGEPRKLVKTRNTSVRQPGSVT